MKDRAPLIVELHDKICVAHHQRPLVRRAKPCYLHRDALPAAGVEPTARALRDAFQIECCAEVRGLEGVARDVERVRSRVDYPQRLQQSQKPLAHPEDGMPIRKLLTPTGQPAADLLRLAAPDEGVHVARCGGRGGVHDQED